MEHAVDDILNECIESILSGEKPENSLKKYPGQAKMLKPLLQTAAATRKAAMVAPDATYKNLLKKRLIALAVEMKTRPIKVATVWRSAWFTGLAVFLVLVVILTGTVTAAQTTMPGGFLYGVKLSSEKVWLAVHTSTISKLDYSAQLANSRVSELIYELGKDNVDSKDLDMAAKRLDNALAQIEKLANQDDGQLNVQQAVNVAEIKDKEKSRLIQALALYAVNNSQVLQNEMQTAPNEVKPQIENAINQTIDSFDKAIQSIENGSAVPAP